MELLLCNIHFTANCFVIFPLCLYHYGSSVLTLILNQQTTMSSSSQNELKTMKDVEDANGDHDEAEQKCDDGQSAAAGGGGGHLTMSDVLGVLDEVEVQIEAVRKSCQHLMDEKQSLLATISAVVDSAITTDKAASSSSRGQSAAVAESDVQEKDQQKRPTNGGGLSPVDEEELALTAQRLRNRLESVQMAILVQRDSHQQMALAKVNALLDQLIAQVEKGEDGAQLLATASSYREACVGGGTGSKFESLLIQCTSQDQKEIKARVVQLYSQISVVLATQQVTLDD